MSWGPTSELDPRTLIHSPVNYQHGNVFIKQPIKNHFEKRTVKLPISTSVHPLDHKSVCLKDPYPN